YKRHRYPPAIIAHAVWLYLRVSLSLRAVEEMLLERGVEVTYERVRRWIAKFGPVIARGLRRRQDRPGRVCHLDEVQVAIRGRRFWLWRAVDEHGAVLEEILQQRRDRKAAKRLLRRLLKTAGSLPKRIVTDKLGSYAAAKREIAPGLEHRAHKGLNNRAENSHLPFRSRERVMRGHRSAGGLQRFVAMHSAVRNRFVPVARRRRSAQATRYHRLEAFDVWREAAGIAA
ncbi:MAG: IS6 family transposase, partial [Pseudomonadota bacterium]